MKQKKLMGFAYSKEKYPEKFQEVINSNAEKHRNKPAWNKGLTKEINENIAKGAQLISETRKKLFEEGKLEHPLLNKHHSEETKEKIKLKATGRKSSLKGRKRSEEFKQKVSESVKEKWNNPDYVKKTMDGFIERSQNLEFIKKLSESKKEWAKEHPTHYSNMGKISAKKGNYERLLKWKKEHPDLVKKIASDTIKKTMIEHPEMRESLSKWRKENPEKATQLVQQNWIKMIERNPNILSETAKNTHQKYPNLASENAIKSQEKMKEKGPEYYTEHQRKAGKIGGQKGGKITQQRHPNQSSEIAKRTHQIYPNLAIERGKIMHQKWKERDPEGYSLHQSNAMLAVKRPTKPETIMRSILPEDFIFDTFFKCGVPDFRSEQRKIILQVDGPRHYKEMGKDYNQVRLLKTQLKDKNQESIWTNEGYAVYRFTDIEITKNLEMVKFKLKQILNTPI